MNYGLFKDKHIDLINRKPIDYKSTDIKMQYRKHGKGKYVIYTSTRTLG